MRSDSHHAASAPGPLCTAFAPLLPLLHVGELQPEEAGAVWAHVDGCAWCDGRLRELVLVGARLREALRHEEPVPMLTMEAIMQVAEDREPREAREAREARIGLVGGGPHGKGSWRTAVAALAAALAVAVLAGLVFASKGLPVGTAPGHPTAAPATPQVARYAAPTAGRPSIVGVDGAGNAWFWVEIPGHGNATLYRMSAKGAVTSITLPNVATDLTVARVEADGTLWLLDGLTGRIWHFDPQTGAVTPVPVSMTIPRVDGVAVPPDDTFWLYTALAGQYGAFIRIDPHTGASRMFPLPEHIGDMLSPAADAHGVVWFGTEATPHNYIVRFDTNTERMLKIEITHLTHADSLDFPPCDGLRTSPDGGAWAIVGTDERVVGTLAGGTLSTEDWKLLRVRPDGSAALYPFPAGGQYTTGFGVDAASNLSYLADTGARLGPNGTLPESAAILIERVSPDGHFQTTASVPMKAFVTADTGPLAAFFAEDGSIWMLRIARKDPTTREERAFLVRIAPAW